MRKAFLLLLLPVLALAQSAVRKDNTTGAVIDPVNGLPANSIVPNALRDLSLAAAPSKPFRISNTNGYFGWTVGSSFSYDGIFYVFYSDLTQSTLRSTSIDGATWSEGYQAPEFYSATTGKSFFVTSAGVQTSASGGTAGTFWAIASTMTVGDSPPTLGVHTLYKSNDQGVSWTSLGTLPDVPASGQQPDQFTGITQLNDGQMAAVWGRDGSPFKTGIIKWPVTATDTSGVTSITVATERGSDSQIYSDSDGAIMGLRWDTANSGDPGYVASPKVAFSADSGATWTLSTLTDLPANDAEGGSSIAVTRKGDYYILMAFNRYANGAGQGQIFLWTAPVATVKAAPASAGGAFTLQAYAGNVPGRYTGSNSSIAGQGALVAGTVSAIIPGTEDKVLLTFSAGTSVPDQGYKGDVYGMLLDFGSNRIAQPLVSQAEIAALRYRRPPTVLLAQTTTEPYVMHPGSRIVCTTGPNYVRPFWGSQFGDVIEIEKGSSSLAILGADIASPKFYLRDGTSTTGSYGDATAIRKTIRLTCMAASATVSEWLIDDEQGSWSSDNLKLPATTSLAVGTIQQDGSRFLHSYSNGGQQNVFLGALAGNFTTTSSGNLGLGATALFSITTGSNTVAIGTSALQLATTSTQNVAIGESALSTTTTGGDGNVAIGNLAQDALTTGDFNTSVGWRSGRTITTGSNNLALGEGADVGAASGAYRTAIGSESVNDLADNSILLGRQNGSDTVYIPGVLSLGRDIATRVTGKLKLSGSSSGTITIQPANAAGTYTLTLPTDDGTANQVLTTDGNGVLSWAAGGSGLTIGTTPITSGGAGRILFEGSGGLLQEDGLLTYNSGTATLELVGTITGNVLTATDGLTANLIAGAITLSSFSAGTMDNVAVGQTTPLAGKFTTLQGTGAVTLSPANNNVVLSPTGTGVVTINPATAGTMNNVNIGGTTRGTGAFTTLAANSTGQITGTLTLGDGSAATAILASNLSGATDPTLTFSNATITSSGAFSCGSNSITCGNISMGALNNLTITSGMALICPSDGVVRLTNAGATDFGRLCLGLATSSFPAFKRSSTAVAVRLADDSADAPLTASRLSTPKQTVATLAAGATTFAVTSNVAVVTGDSGGNTVATITGGITGMILVLIFTDNKITITDDATATANTINLSAAFTSTANDTMTLVFDGTSWFEVARSVN